MTRCGTVNPCSGLRPDLFDPGASRDAGELPVADELLLIAGCDNPILADFVAHVGQHKTGRLAVVSTSKECRGVGEGVVTYPADGFAPAAFLSAHEADAVRAVVVLLGRRGSDRERRLLDAVAEVARVKRVTSVCIVSTFRVHFGDRRAERAEAYALDRFQTSGAAVSVVRPSYVVSRRSRTAATLRALAWCYPLVAKRFTGCCLAGEDLFAAIEREVGTPVPRRRTYTLLGPNRPWADVLRDNMGRGLGSRTAAGIATVLSWLFVGRLLGALLTALGKAVPRLRPWNFNTLHPASARELLALYNPYNFRHVKVVGYNNGVVHFGQRHPGKTVVSTVRCNRVARVNGRTARFDAGVTIRQAIDVLNRAGKEFYVLPNYTFVSLGTAFFVPIHGSASEFSTMGDN